VVNVLTTTLKSGNLPHMLFHGPPGSGKTSVILALAKQLFGSATSQRVLELNASNERGIDVIRSKVKTFAMNKVYSDGQGVEEDGVFYPCPPFKIIILDEADSMTSNAQAALRRIMEDFMSSTRFCIICNYVSKLIDPIVSRCAIFRFSRIPNEIHLQRLRTICESEGRKASESVLSFVVDKSDGDLRKSINILQAAFRASGSEEELSAKHVGSLMGDLPDSVLDDFLNLVILETDPLAVSEAARQLVQNAVPLEYILLPMCDRITSQDFFNESEKIEAIHLFSRVADSVVRGSDEETQVIYLALSLHHTLRRYRES
jgi:replication factor C subunit 2/4